MKISMGKEFDTGLMWFRRDLRTDDNAALYHALKQCKTLHCVFIFDKEILESLPKSDRRVEFIRESLLELDASINKLAKNENAGLIVQHAWANDAIPKLAQELAVQAVFTNHDYEPQAVHRDAVVLGKLADLGITFHTFKDHVIFERTEVLTQMGKPYGVFTPYKNACLKKLNEFYLKSYPVEKHIDALTERPVAHRQSVPTLAEFGFKSTNLATLKIPTGMSGGRALFEDFFDRMDDYHITRDFPAVKGPSYLGVHLRFGTVSIRKLAATAHQRTIVGSQGAAVWLSELIWRDFYFQILSNFPHAATGAFKPEYNDIKWEHGEHAEKLFAAWCEGRTGYPLVDAAMAQINQTGYMHNRLRMVVASFLVKDLGIDWRLGERYFAEHLNDFDQSANNGGWQWASSSGCDAQPYFRIFNPTSQSEKFDSEGKFIRKYLPQLSKLPNNALHEPWNAKPIDLQAASVRLGDNYPHPIVNHAQAREQTLLRYAVVKKSLKAT
jgi:deoxyribodipyrimidine photo-lyase